MPNEISPLGESTSGGQDYDLKGTNQLNMITEAENCSLVNTVTMKNEINSLSQKESCDVVEDVLVNGINGMTEKISCCLDSDTEESNTITDDNSGCFVHDLEDHISEQNIHYADEGKHIVTEVSRSQAPVQSPPPPPPPPPPPVSSQYVSPIKVPDPQRKMRSLPWKRITKRKANNLWDKLRNMKDPVPVDYEEIEGKFFSKDNNGRKSSTSRARHLLEGQKEMRIDMFLKRSQKTPDELIEMIKIGCAETMGYENLKILRHNLPTNEECDLLHDVPQCELTILGKVDYFMVQLIKVPDYELQINVMITERELDILTDIPNSLQILRVACNMLMTNDDFHRFLRYVFEIGLFINKDKLVGKAVGFKITSLQEVNKFRSTDEKSTFLDIIVKELKKSQPNCLDFVGHFEEHLEKTKGCSMEQIQEDFSGIEKKIVSLLEKLDRPTCSITDKCSSFQQTAKTKLEKVRTEITNINIFTEEVVEYFAEDKDDFSMDELLTTCRDLCKKIKDIQKQSEVTSSPFKRGGQRASMPTIRRGSALSSKPGYDITDKRLQEILEKQKRRSDSFS